MNTSNSIKEKVLSNNVIWDNWFKTYQRDSRMPGVKYPNEHLVRFLNAIAKDGAGKKRVLELGFGTIANMLAMQKYGFEVLGLEISEDAVKRTQSAIDENGLNDFLKVDIFEGNTLPVEDNSFDMIVGLQCIYYNVDQELFAKECARVLKPGGKIFFSLFSPRHDYMKYIEGKPGSIVKFKDTHPNPRLKGLELFLFKSEEQFKEIYGKYFDIQLGLDEFDLYPIFMSWRYLIGQKRPIERPLPNFVSTSPGLPKSEPKETCNIDPDGFEENNYKLWKVKLEKMYLKDTIPGNKYPNEHFIRFLVTRGRGVLNKFYTNIGKEDKISGSGEKILELMPHNISNLLMAQDMGYDAHGTMMSQVAINKSGEAMRDLGREKNIFIEEMNKGAFSYMDEEFRFVIGEKAGSYLSDQDRLVREVARVTMKGGEIFIGYLSPKHGYMNWAEPLGSGYFRITDRHPDPTMWGMVIYTQEKEVLRKRWEKYFDVEIKSVEFNLHRYYSSFYFVKGKKAHKGGSSVK